MEEAPMGAASVLMEAAPMVAVAVVKVVEPSRAVPLALLLAATATSEAETACR